MPKKAEFHTVEFFRNVRDQQAAILAEKTPAEIISFFNPSKKVRLPRRENVTRRISGKRDR